MKDYKAPEFEIITIYSQDVITTSGGYSQVGGIEGWAPDSDDSEFGG